MKKLNLIKNAAQLKWILNNMLTRMFDVRFNEEQTLMQLFWSLVVMTVKCMNSKIHKTFKYNQDFFNFINLIFDRFIYFTK